MDVIKCGGFEWVRDPRRSDNRIDSLDMALANSIVCDKLSIDTMTAELFSTALLPQLFCTADGVPFVTQDGKYFCVRGGKDLRTIPYGTPVEYYRNGTLFAKLFKKSILRTGKAQFELTAVSAIGLLDKLRHYGNIYVSTRADAVLADIMGDSIVYTVAPELATVMIWGHLPIDTRRKNLQKFLMATGASIKKNADGSVLFTFLEAAEAKTVDSDDIYEGGSVTNGTPATGVDVTAHNYVALATDLEVTLFDNTDGTSGEEKKTVTFANPCHDLVVTGTLAIKESGVNYAVVSGIGTLTGKEYTHQTDVFSLRKDNYEGEENIVTVQDCTLVSVANVENVAKRVLDYYGAAERVKTDIVVTDQRPGDGVELLDPFDETARGFLESMEIGVSGLLKAGISVITNYAPSGMGNYYETVTAITEDGNWTAEKDGKIHVIIMQAGQGGQSGAPGEDAKPGELRSTKEYEKTTQIRTMGIPGEGGKPGAGGNPGNIYRLTLTVKKGDSFACKIGKGGLGGVYDNNENKAPVDGTEGEHSTFGAYSSAMGAQPAAGFYDIFSGEIYALKGESGIKGGRGSGHNPDGSNYDDVLEGETVTGPNGETWKPGASTKEIVDEKASDTIYEDGSLIATVNFKARLFRGCGGGPAAGSNGTEGKNNGTFLYKFDSRLGNNYAKLTASSGANGADATLEPVVQSVRGSGGNGGHGGGGAAGNGATDAYVSIYLVEGKSYSCPLTSGEGEMAKGGAPSPGSAGANGLILIYH